ncbi:hypothetical protein [Pararhizobium antarcticum]|uniref:Uncharacterized protein n=1 Tax=Pararhizobium antarcticum TaxID=1798805 RepID=A0A657LMT7_9HYPH|nr:hypothetical protein [Pararhizobium antarcticum]OJF92563.1 hypothetical protein AX760_22430 [Pararhizobium antarcticum]OJF95830.1 hypothetical protein AX761_16975 [Rhizobium sp. 58]
MKSALCRRRAVCVIGVTMSLAVIVQNVQVEFHNKGALWLNGVATADAGAGVADTGVRIFNASLSSPGAVAIPIQMNSHPLLQQIARTA